MARLLARRLVEHDDVAHAAALAHRGEAVVDALQRQARGDQRVELEPAVEVEPGEPGKSRRGRAPP